MTPAATKAAAAADALQAWLDRPREGRGRRPATIDDAVAGPAAENAATAHRTNNGLALDTQVGLMTTTMAEDTVGSWNDNPTLPVAPPNFQMLAHTDWLFHHLDVSGPAEDLHAFQQAARGAGTIPWQLDLDAMREDLFHLLAAPKAPQSRTLSAAGARRLAEELCVAVGRRHAVAVARVGVSAACPFDLHALVPVPSDMLDHGPDHPKALAWLWTHWGTTRPLRHVTLLARPVLAHRLALRFWSADWTPWPAIAALRVRWPTLRLDVQPQYDAT